MDTQYVIALVVVAVIVILWVGVGKRSGKLKKQRSNGSTTRPDGSDERIDRG